MTAVRPRVVLMEDNPADVLLIREALNEQGLEVDLQVIHDGESALLWVGRSEPADLIMLDLNLPRHDGAEVLETIRQTPGLSGVPVLILSSSDAPQDHAKAEDLGADRFIAKPCTLDEFLAVGRDIKAMLAAGRTKAPTVRTPSPPAAAPQPGGSNSER